MRLFALSCALVGQFAEVFRFLLKHWRQGLAKQAEFVQGLVVTVLPDGAKGDALTALVMRNFWVWLVVIALVSVGLLF
jgi:membrane protein required for beta-lactamase induction